MTKRIVWVHGDALSPTNTALMRNPHDPAVYVWDEALIEHYGMSLKRMVFMYECLLEMDVTIRRGRMAEELLQFAIEHGATEIATVETPAPRFGQIASLLSREGMKVVVYRPKPFINADITFDLKRFSRYWRKAQPYAQQHSSQMRLFK